MAVWVVGRVDVLFSRAKWAYADFVKVFTQKIFVWKKWEKWYNKNKNHKCDFKISTG